MTAWQNYKKKREEDLINGSRVNPIDLLNKNNYTTTEISSARFEICKTCPELIELTSQCKKCGCFMKLKTQLLNATCPIQKW